MLHVNISIHALRKESDSVSACNVFTNLISIHALRKESDGLRRLLRLHRLRCQSTLSGRRATEPHGNTLDCLHISIHALRKESDWRWFSRWPDARISIHALRKESDLPSPNDAHCCTISIHALRKESDDLPSELFRDIINNFNPRSP